MLPTKVISDTDAQWVGQSVTQSLQADLKNASLAHTPSDFSEDPASLARLAHNASADAIIAPHAQVIQDQIRLTATTFDSQGKRLSTAKITGDKRQLFDLEDALADQLQNALAPQAVKHQIRTPIPQIETSGPIRLAVAKPMPIGTVPESFSSPALRDARDRYIYQVPAYGCWGWGGYGGFGCGSCWGGLGWGGFGRGGLGWGATGWAGFDPGYSTGGRHSLAW